MSLAEDSVLNAKQAAADTLLRPDSYSNVLAVGVGRDCFGKDCVRIYVQSMDAHGVDKIKGSFLGVDTCVIEIGRFGRLKQGPARGKEMGPGFPIRFDTTAPNVNSRAIGTLGATVRYGDDYFILSCNHILAVNGRLPKDTRIVAGELVGAEVEPEEIAIFPGDGYFVEIGHDPISPADCALARLNKDRIPEGFHRVEPTPPLVGMKVTKEGAITGRTKGTIVDILADVSVDYSFGTFRFNDQILIEGEDGQEFAWDGDSGSIVIDMESGYPTAMVFAEAGKFAVACPLSRVFGELEKLPAFKGKADTRTMSLENLRRP
jgi:hypothetical protein